MKLKSVLLGLMFLVASAGRANAGPVCSYENFNPAMTVPSPSPNWYLTGQRFSLGLNCHGQQGGELTYFMQVSGPSPGDFGSTSGSFISYKPVGIGRGAARVQFTVTEGAPCSFACRFSYELNASIMGAVITSFDSGSVGASFALSANHSDGEGTLTYLWEIASRPVGSAASVSSTSAVTTHITPDMPGDYTVRLTVTDSGSPRRVHFTTKTFHAVPAVNAVIFSTPPGPVGEAIALTANQSTGAPTPLTYRWELTGPLGSTATLSNPDGVSTTFTPDQGGNYDVSLKVTNATGQFDTAAKTIVVSPNSGSINAVITGPGSAELGMITLSGIESTGNPPPNSYSWTLASPDASQAHLSSVNGIQTSFDADIPGNYEVTLRVSNTNQNVSTASKTIEVRANTPLPKVEMDDYLAGIRQFIGPGACDKWGKGEALPNVVNATHNNCGSFNIDHYRTIASSGCSAVSTTVVLGQLGLKYFSNGTRISTRAIIDRAKGNKIPLPGLQLSDGDDFNFLAAAYIYNAEMKTKLSLCNQAGNDPYCDAKFGKAVRYRTVKDNKEQILDQMLAAGIPVVLEVKSHSGSAKHFVVAIGKTIYKGEVTYVIQDVGSSDLTNLKKSYEGEFRNLRLFEPVPPSPNILARSFEALRITAPEEVDFEVIDPNGKRTGFDFDSGTVLNEIPNSSYDVDYISAIGPDDSADTEHRNVFEGPFGLASGTYSIKLRSNISGCKHISLYSYINDYAVNDIRGMTVCFGGSEIKEILFSSSSDPISMRKLSVSSYRVDNEKLANHVTVDGSLDSSFSITAEQGITFSFSGTNLVETVFGGEFVELSDRYELQNFAGHQISSLVLYKNGRFHVELNNLGGVNLDRRYHAINLALVLGHTAYVGTINQNAFPESGLLSVDRGGPSFHIGEKPKVTVHLKTLPKPNYDFDIDASLDASSIVLRRRSSRLYSGALPGLTPGSHEVRVQLVQFHRPTMEKLVHTLNRYSSDKARAGAELTRVTSPARREALELQIRDLSNKISEINVIIFENRQPIGEPVTTILEAIGQ